MHCYLIYTLLQKKSNHVGVKHLFFFLYAFLFFVTVYRTLGTALDFLTRLMHYIRYEMTSPLQVSSANCCNILTRNKENMLETTMHKHVGN